MPGLKDTKDLPIGARGGLVDQKHREAMGEAVWLFLWALHRQTAENEIFGTVLHGRPINWSLIEKDTGFPTRTVRRWMKTLETTGYIETFADPVQPGRTAGFIIRIRKPKKFTGDPAISGTFAGQRWQPPPATSGTHKPRETTKPKTKNPPTPLPFAEPPLPDWIPADAWDGWREMRTALRVPWTQRCMNLAISRLERFRAEGHDPREVLEHCTVSGYRGIYPPGRLNGASGQHIQASRGEQRNAGNRAKIIALSGVGAGVRGDDGQVRGELPRGVHDPATAKLP